MGNNIEAIREFVRISDNVCTSGQPARDQLAGLCGHGIRYVINLALPDSDGAVADEAAILTRQGIAYFHLPVIWEKPTEQDFTVFCGLMRTIGNFPVLVHCALNMRVSAFMFLYRVVELDTPPAEARIALNTVWEPYEQWRSFIAETLAKHSQATEPDAGMTAHGRC